VAAIAVVHETLSNGAETDEKVDIDLIIDRLMALVVDVSPTSERISVVRAGNAGHLPPHRATPLAMVLAELFQNALEHGLASSGETLTVTVTGDDPAPVGVTVTVPL
jgi:two-component sensor histidine kinase